MPRTAARRKYGNDVQTRAAALQEVISMLPPVVEAEVQALAMRFGAPLRRDVVLENDGLFDPLGKRDRYGEVCMVVRRPNVRLITAIKTFYPPGAFRLLT